MYHIIFVYKYRKKLLVFNEKIIKELFIEISKNQDFIILANGKTTIFRW